MKKGLPPIKRLISSVTPDDRYGLLDGKSPDVVKMMENKSRKEIQAQM